MTSDRPRAHGRSYSPSSASLTSHTRDYATSAHRSTPIALGLPAIYQFSAAAEEGGFIAYGTNLDQIYRNISARQLVKLVRGAKPADIPIEQPTKFELVINLKTAKALGLTIPESLLVRADKVIE